MKLDIKRFTEHALLVSNVFILFLIIFFDRIAVPNWLQSIGRMHPMLLHFPIVLLLLAFFLEFFRFKTFDTDKKSSTNFSTNLLLCGTLLAALTAIMGLVLSKEEGYTGNALFWHKWAGVSVVFVASTIYWLRTRPWHKIKVAKIGAVIVTACLIIAGHYGAILTHGENFIWEPIISTSKTATVPIDQAKIFEHVVMPIFTQKCVNCHSTEKAKGNLILADVQSLLKGGKVVNCLFRETPKLAYCWNVFIFL
ncbi:hypothetical protein H8S90_23085 [Olivibacter sp. SDN3]|uniref:DUF2231 domain-containing protein n=1 Tax=Olivibacter sp. SDN3 TaxID=2764720 RepID=UPI001651071A|nr:DUF2231 domain-containing protein [Olivibacter sp. SDN3]QNL49573.1 hypothetical protein H8S90_23085 [Olivibacter sp. SDN3]